MSETVCVPVEQLREIEWEGESTALGNRCPVCGGFQSCTVPQYVAKYGVGHAPECWLGNAIEQADRLKDWVPKVGDLVRLKAKPEVVGRIVAISDDEAQVHFHSAPCTSSRIWRYLTELMPAEAE